ncbi:MAG: DUF1697 domain-containing protein [bacterium]
MIYIALLRGINVGGNGKVEMKKLKTTFENLGFSKAKTYINSGNIIFEDSNLSHGNLIQVIQEAILKDFGFSIKVLIRSIDSVENVVKAIPETWQNNTEMKTDIMFLWDEVDSKEVLNQFKSKPGIDNLLYLSGAVVWNIDRKNYNQSSIPKMIGTKLYSQMTARNVNTVRKVCAMMKALR